MRYLFDHHDINPELYLAKFGKKGWGYRAMVWAERLTFKAAFRSIATNESYREIAIRRGKMNPQHVHVVRSGPSLERLKIQSPDLSCKKGRKFLIGYIGVIGVQEGIDLAVESVQYILSSAMMYSLRSLVAAPLAEVQQMAEVIGVLDHVNFYGRVSDEEMLRILNSSDVCVNPDRPTEMNNLSTMNKIMEYMALAKPIVQSDLKEGRASAVPMSDPRNTVPMDFGDKIIELLDDPDRVPTWVNLATKGWLARSLGTMSECAC